MHPINIICTATIMTIKGEPKPDKMLFLVCNTSPMPCYLYCHANCASFIMACLFACRIYSYACAFFLCWPLLVWFFLRIDTEQGIYQETQEHYPDPSLSSTELPGKHYHMLPYIQYLLPLSYSCIIGSRLH